MPNEIMTNYTGSMVEKIMTRIKIQIAPRIKVSQIIPSVGQIEVCLTNQREGENTILTTRGGKSTRKICRDGVATTAR